MPSKRTITPLTNPQAFEGGGQGRIEDLDGAPEDWRVAVDQAAPDTDPEDDEARSTADRLRAALARPQDVLRVKLYRKERTGALAWCADYTPREFLAGDLEMVREQWGPGDYQVRLIGPKGLTMREDLTLARPLERSPAPVRDDGPMAAILAQLAQGQERIAEALAQRPDPMAQLQQTMALLATMREAFAPPPAPAAPSVNPSSMLADIVGAVRQLREVAAEVNPPAADPSDPASMLPAIIDLVRAGQAQQAVPQLALPSSFDASPAPPADYQPDAAATAPEPNPAPDTMNPLQKLILRGLLNRLLTLARDNAPPEQAAAWVLEKAPDELIGYLDLDTCVDMLVSVAPEAEPHRAWLELVRRAALAQLDAEDADPT
jgi:hypothetical protein